MVLLAVTGRAGSHRGQALRTAGCSLAGRSPAAEAGIVGSLAAVRILVADHSPGSGEGTVGNPGCTDRIQTL